MRQTSKVLSFNFNKYLSHYRTVNRTLHTAVDTLLRNPWYSTCTSHTDESNISLAKAIENGGTFAGAIRNYMLRSNTTKRNRPSTALFMMSGVI